MIRSLLSESKESLNLLSMFTFYFIPMVNPDGVIHGNSRTNLSGYDLNRCWDQSGLLRSSECLDINKAIEKIADTEGIEYTIDLHGHSR
jgi:murein tripeptide amidase MpaA